MWSERSFGPSRNGQQRACPDDLVVAPQQIIRLGAGVCISGCLKAMEYKSTGLPVPLDHQASGPLATRSRLLLPEKCGIALSSNLAAKFLGVFEICNFVHVPREVNR